MRISRARRWLRPAAAGGLLIAAATGAVAYAAIPGDGSVYRACMLKNVGTIRLIDPSLPSGSVVSHCTSLETQVSWNQSGRPGPAGAKGEKGEPGLQGPPGQFTGTLTSPNGAYSISVTDASIVLRAPGAAARLVGEDILLDSGSSTTVHAGTGVELVAGQDLDLASGGDTRVQATQGLAASSGSDATLAVGRDLSMAVARATTFQGGGGMTVAVAGPLRVNGAPIP